MHAHRTNDLDRRGLDRWARPTMPLVGVWNAERIETQGLVCCNNEAGRYAEQIEVHTHATGSEIS